MECAGTRHARSVIVGVLRQKARRFEHGLIEKGMMIMNRFGRAISISLSLEAK